MKNIAKSVLDKVKAAFYMFSFEPKNKDSRCRIRRLAFRVF